MIISNKSQFIVRAALATAFLLATISGLIPVQALGSAAPDLAVPESSFDFGTAFAGEELEHTFSVRNNGVKPVELRQRTVAGLPPSFDGDRGLRARVLPASFAAGFSPAPAAPS